MELAVFLSRFGAQLMERANTLFPPQTTGDALEVPATIRRAPLPGQARVIPALLHSLRRCRHTWLVAEMSTGKSYIAAVAAELFGARRSLVLCPPHLVVKWAREVALASGRETFVIRSLTDLERHKNELGVFIMSREVAKLESRWRAAYATRRRRNAFDMVCPDCYRDITFSDGFVSPADLEREKRFCSCGAALWTITTEGGRRTPLARYIKRRFKRNHFDLLVLDEVHEYKGEGSAQGISAGSLSAHCAKTLLLTGTLAGGYASTLFSLLFRFSSAFRTRYKINEVGAFVATYGLLERITDVTENTDGKKSSRKSERVRVKEKPGISPLVLTEFLDNTAFLRLSDLGIELAPYREYVHTVAMDTAQRQAYEAFENEVRITASGFNKKRVLALAMQKLLFLPDTPWREEVVRDQTPDGHMYTVAASRPLPEDVTYPKERELVEIVSDARSNGRRVIVFVQGTEIRDITGRLRDTLERHGLRTLVLKSKTVKAEAREAYIETRLDQTDVMICHPRIVQTGLDLIGFPVIVFYQVEYSTYVLRQSARRSWRIGQREPVEVIFLGYEGSVQTVDLKLVSAKARSSLALEGELSETGLSNYSDEGDVLVALARTLMGLERPPEQELARYRLHGGAIHRADRTIASRRRGSPNLVARDDLLLFPLETLLEDNPTTFAA